MNVLNGAKNVLHVLSSPKFLNILNGAKARPANIVIKDPLPEHIPRGPWTEQESYQVM